MEFDFLIPVIEFRTEETAPDYELPFWCRMGHELKRRGYRVGFLTQSRIADQRMQESNHPYFNLYDIVDELKQKGAISYSIGQVSKIEQSYNIDIKELGLCECLYYYRKPKQLFKQAIEYFAIIEDFLAQNPTKCIIHPAGGELIRRVLFHVGRGRGILNVFMTGSPVWGSLFFTTDETLTSDQLSLKPYQDLTADEIEQAERFITSFVERKEMFIRSKYRPLWRINPLAPLKLPQKAYRRYVVNKGQEPFPLFAEEVAHLKRKVRGLMYKSFIKMLEPGEKFLFFPLHLYRESQLTVRAPQCLNQAYIVDLVASSLPYGYKLYVKEHPNHLGEIPYGMMRAISKTRDTVLLDPQTHSHELIESSVGVITINSLAGLEGILYRKPVVVLGKPFYGQLGLTIDVEDYSYLHDAIKEVLEAKDTDHAKVVSLVNAVLKNSYKGVLWEPGEQNIKDISDSILSYLDRRELLASR
ncbi:MAG: hypothetical protein ISS51_00700 [Dehalococcoidales bacterium]|nr:hypothetical protein [Dehalococcoidales bacterium]